MEVGRAVEGGVGRHALHEALELGAPLLEPLGAHRAGDAHRLGLRDLLVGERRHDRAGELLRELRREPVKVAEASHHVELAELELRQRRPRRHLVRVVRRDAVAHLARVQHRDRQVGRGGVRLRLRRRREPRRRRRRRDVDVEQRLAAKRLGSDGGRVRGGRRRGGRGRGRGRWRRRVVAGRCGARHRGEAPLDEAAEQARRVGRRRLLGLLRRVK